MYEVEFFYYYFTFGIIRSNWNNFFLGKGGPELNNDIWYQYKEGYNNAVRKIIRISDLS